MTGGHRSTRMMRPAAIALLLGLAAPALAAAVDEVERAALAGASTEQLLAIARRNPAPLDDEGRTRLRRAGVPERVIRVIEGKPAEEPPARVAVDRDTASDAAERAESAFGKRDAARQVRDRSSSRAAATGEAKRRSAAAPEAGKTLGNMKASAAQVEQQQQRGREALAQVDEAQRLIGEGRAIEAAQLAARVLDDPRFPRGGRVRCAANLAFARAVVSGGVGWAALRPLSDVAAERCDPGALDAAAALLLALAPSHPDAGLPEGVAWIADPHALEHVSPVRRNELRTASARALRRRGRLTEALPHAQAVPDGDASRAAALLEAARTRFALTDRAGAAAGFEQAAGAARRSGLPAVADAALLALARLRASAGGAPDPSLALYAQVAGAPHAGRARREAFRLRAAAGAPPGAPPEPADAEGALLTALAGMESDPRAAGELLAEAQRKIEVEQRALDLGGGEIEDAALQEAAGAARGAVAERERAEGPAWGALRERLRGATDAAVAATGRRLAEARAAAVTWRRVDLAALLAEVRDAAIEAGIAAIGGLADPATRSGLRKRTSELLAESVRAAGDAADSSTCARRLRIAELRRDEAREHLEDGGADEWLGAAAVALDETLSSCPQFDERDRALYLRGLVEVERGQPKGAAAPLSALVQNFPESDLAPPSHLMLAEIAFDAGSWAAARDGYRATLRKPADDLQRAYALYKLAWTDFNGTRLWDAARGFAAAVEAATATPVGADLRRSALADMALPYGALDNAWPAADREFRRLGGPEASGHLVRVAALLDERGAHADAASLLRRVLEAEPLAPEAPAWHEKLAAAVAAQGSLFALARLADEIRDHYAKDGAWARAHGADPARAAEAARVVQQAYFEQARLAKRPGGDRRKPGDPAARHRAIEAWRKLLAVTPDGPRAREVRMQLAHDLLDSDEFEAAAAEFALVAAEPGKLREDASHGRARAWEQHVLRLEASKADAAAARRELGAAADAYAGLFAQDKQAAPIAMAAADAFARAGDDPEAARRLADVADRWPRAAEAQQARWRLLEVYDRSGGFGELEALARAMLAARPKEAEARDLADAIVHAVIKGAQARTQPAEAAGNAAKLRAAAEELAASGLAVEALYWGGEESLRAGNAGDAVALWARARDEHPEAEFGARAAVRLAAFHDQRGDFDAAAEAYARAVAIGADRDGSIGLRAARLQLALGRSGRALALLESARKAGRLPHEADETLCELAARGRETAGLRLCEELAAAAPAELRGAVLARAAELALSIDAKRAPALAQQAAAAAASPAIRARAALARGDAEAWAMERIDLLPPAERQRRALEQRLALFEKAKAAYLEAIAQKEPRWAIVGGARIGLAIASIVRAIRTAPIPPGLTSEEVEAYRAALDEQAFGLEETASAGLREVIENASRLGVSDPAVVAAADALRELRPDELARTQFGGPSPAMEVR